MMRPLAKSVWRVALWLMVACATCAADKASIKEVTFTAKSDESQQRYLLILPRQFDENDQHDVLILLHGHGSNRQQILDDSVNEFRAGRDVASEHRMLVVSPDYRGRTSWMGPQAESDLQQIIADLKSDCRINKVIVAGASMGGSSALTFAAMHPELVNGVVAMNGTANHIEFENFQDAISKSFGGCKAQIPFEYKKRSAEYWPECFTMPVAITASGQDKTVPPASAVRLANAIRKLQPDNVLLIFREAAGHETSYEDSKAAFEFALGSSSQTESTRRAAQESL